MRYVLVASAMLAAAGGMPASAANTFVINYYTIAGTYGAQAGDPDFNTIGCCTPTFYGEAETALGPNGLPVFNPSGDYASAGYTVHDQLATGEITWWSPQYNSNVRYTGTSTITTPFSNFSFYPTNGMGGDDGPASGFQGATITGSFDIITPEQVTFSFGADDDAFLALDGQLIAQEGGIHGVAAAPVTTSTLAAGIHTLELFYVDRNQTGAGLYFNVDTSDIVVSPPTSAVPEPASWAMMVGGFGVLGSAIRRRQRTGLAFA